ncbi:MAG: hypothetical protein EOO73_12295 [Myxococcales bacterium]|nr:MAG: hypothetical protein EOO73_12295 [Myxococcales bacterium]
MGEFTGPRARGVVLGVLLACTALACGNTKRAPVDEGNGEGGAASPPASGGTDAGGPFPAGSGSLGPTGGSTSTGGGESTAGAGGEPPACVDGAPCNCEDLPGVVQCQGAEASQSGQCSCPPAGDCRPSRGTCFEPCGGDARGIWVLEQTCFPGAEPAGCAGATVSGSSSSQGLVIRIVEDEPVTVLSTSSLQVRAQVPLTCLGIESVQRCVDAEYYVSPTFFMGSRPLACAASDCGDCECSGELGVYGGGGPPWQPGSDSLPFGSIATPFCVEGDTMWAGGGEVEGEPKVAYKLRRRSCVGTPQPCAERAPDQCEGSGDCQPGRCVVVGPTEHDCPGLVSETCSYSEGCEWVPGGCWGTASERCDYGYCEATPGCSWGPPEARCGGEPRFCHELTAPECDVPGCSMRTCEVPDGWSGIDAPPCERLIGAAACSKAAGCTWSGSSCVGTTTCGSQTDPAVCTMLECDVFDEPICGGIPNRPCPELSVEECAASPGCHLVW